MSGRQDRTQIDGPKLNFGRAESLWDTSALFKQCSVPSPEPGIQVWFYIGSVPALKSPRIAELPDRRALGTSAGTTVVRTWFGTSPLVRAGKGGESR